MRFLAIAVTLLTLVLTSGVAQARELTPIAEVSPGVFIASAEGAGGGESRTPETGARTSDTRIVGGSETTISQWPWQAAIAFRSSVVPGNGQARQFCGGTLVAPTIIVTAAHCFYDNPGPGFSNPNLYSAITGRTVLSSNTGQEIPFSTYYTFTDSGGNQLYDPNTNEWDVVVVELATSSSSTPIKIAGADETAVWAPGSTAFATGWGDTSEGGSSSDTLRVVELGILADSSCSSAYGGGYVPSVMACAGVLAGGKDTCQGDSGGPLVVPINAGGYRFVGDTSFGNGCARPNVPGVYGRLASDPIRSSIRNAVLNVAGVDVVGSGAQPPAPPPPPPPPPPAPAGLTSQQALDLTWAYSLEQCEVDRRCRRYSAGACVPQAGGGFICKVKNYEKTRRGKKFTCTRQIFWPSTAGSIDLAQPLGKWKCRLRWR
jgi:hypothetical protein